MLGKLAVWNNWLTGGGFGLGGQVFKAMFFLCVNLGFVLVLHIDLQCAPQNGGKPKGHPSLYAVCIHLTVQHSGTYSPYIWLEKRVANGKSLWQWTHKNMVK